MRQAPAAFVCLGIAVQLLVPDPLLLSRGPAVLPDKMSLQRPCLARGLSDPRWRPAAVTGRKPLRCTAKIAADSDSVHDDRQLREFVLASMQVEPLFASCRATCLAVAAMRCDAFQAADMSVDERIARRFDALGVIRERLKKGATCLVASIEGPFPPGVLLRLQGRAELQIDADKEAFRKLLSERKGEVLADVVRNAERAGEQTPGAGTSPVRIPESATKLARILEAWRDSTRGRRLVLGAVDVSTHEFDLSPAWRACYGDEGVYLSDMAVDAGFRRLGVGALLLAAALDFSQTSGVRDSFLHVEERNTAALPIYRAAGFELVEDSPATEDFFRALYLHEEPHHNMLLKRTGLKKEEGA